MLTPNSSEHDYVSSVSNEKKLDTSSELKFITELGRSLLFTVHPKKAASLVVEAIQTELNAEICAFIVELEQIGLVSSCFAPNDLKDEYLNRKKFKRWLEFLPLKISFPNENKEDFFLNNKTHLIEYISPIHINGRVKGALIVGFKDPENCTDSAMRLIDAATQMAALSVNLSAHYEAAIDTSIHQAKEEHRKFTEAILDALPVSLYVIDRDYKIATWNRHREIGEQGIPRDSAIGRNIFQVLTKYPQDRLKQEFERAFQTGKIERIEQRTLDDDGKTKHWLVSKIPMRHCETGEITHVITVGEDVTVRVEAIHAVGRAEKLAAIGRLAAGVVHEINNPLATISACAESLEARAEEGVFGNSEETQDLREYLGLIRSEAFRCKVITNGLLDFSRMRSGNRFPLDVAEILKSSARLIAHQKRGDNIKIEFDIAENIPSPLADGGQIQQAVINLAANAIDAMPDGGTLTFRAFSQGNQVTIEVQDTGIGIAPENMPKIFEPFFTTKEVGKGTGLGLAVCYGIITENGGKLSVRSNVGVGTTFSIFLPIDKT